MIKNLIVLGIVLVILGGSVAALWEPEAAAVQTELSPTATAEAEPDATSTAEPLTNRENCDEIRGTEYLSREERGWFLANCVRR
jgi:hypothetical protein